MGWKLPPQSECGNYKLVATDKIDNNIYLVLLGDDLGAIKERLTTINQHPCDKLRGYIASLLPEILSGSYDVERIVNE